MRKKTVLILALVILGLVFLVFVSLPRLIKPVPRFTALTYAAASGDLEGVHTLLAQGGDVNERDPTGQTALHRALPRGYFAVFKALLSRGADVNARMTDQPGHTPLILAVRSRTNKQMLFIDELISHGADVNAEDYYGDTVLYHYIRHAETDGNFHPVKVLISNGADITKDFAKYENPQVPFFARAAGSGYEDLVEFMIDKVTVDDHILNAALIRSAQEGHLAIVKTLLAHGADVNARGNRGWPALRYAANGGHTAVVETLLAHGAEVSARYKRGRTVLMLAEERHRRKNASRVRRRKQSFGTSPAEKKAAREGDLNAQLILAVKRGQVEAVKTLLAQGAEGNARDIHGMQGRSALMFAAWRGDSAVVEALLAHGAVVNAEDSRERATALKYAIDQKNNAKVVKLLLENGADINAKIRSAYTLFIYAAHRGDPEVVTALLDKGADVNQKTRDGTTALMVSGREGHLGVVEVLLAHGADVTERDKSGRTALMKGAEWGHTAVVETLLAHGGDVNAPDNAPLVKAAANGHLAVVETLLAHGADANAKWYGPKIALITSAERGHFDVVKTLLANGADMNTKSAYGWTTLMIAALAGHRELVRTLIARGADVDVKDENDNTALRLAEFYNEKEIAQLLRKVGAIE